MSGMARPARPCATYSIVARESDGTIGVAVQSHWYNVGAVVPWVEAGVGAVAVQSVLRTGERTRGDGSAPVRREAERRPRDAPAR